jgi:hypothetical protein
MDKDPDNRVFFDHGGLTAFDDGKNQLLKPGAVPNDQQVYQQEVSDNFINANTHLYFIHTNRVLH